ncbi:FeoA family protein [Clostridium sporogenes]|uniref:Ferrous iron transport protein A n=2 Tax=Clostridium TaxID=1485 RepID=A0A7X5P7X8_CLOSG|nr:MULTISPECIES: FeoA family protein [Clostridium]AJD30264.1 feoA domain protein [Clostridium botulinum Prevot_594]AVP61762.1 ferrous iron transport protein A [Clostridium botulinum]AKC61538.1 ferrous iron transport protein A [Clostridium sporogenes]AKJ88867.1 iron transporter FeoA [Clostridium sporogenes]AVP65345.1 ferrous iron transport protein A [Clostridium botulinum]
MEENCKLSEVPVGKTCKVKELKVKELLKQRILDLGMVPNTEIYVLRRSPWGDPTAYLIRDTCIALRKEEGDKIIVTMN